MEDPPTSKASSAGAGLLALRAVCRNLGGDAILAPDLTRAVLRHRRLARSLALQRQCMWTAARELRGAHAACPLCDTNERLLRRHLRILAALVEHEDRNVRRTAMRTLEAAGLEEEPTAGPGAGQATGHTWRGRGLLRRLVAWARLCACPRRLRAEPPGALRVR